MDQRKKKNSPVAAACSALGTILLIMLAAVCLPLTVPRMFGYHIYTVISGSMEPAIPVGSLLYIQKVQPEDILEQDVIAYYGGRDGTAVIIHRVVENRVLMGEFITKGDANLQEDQRPVPYADFAGKVQLAIPAAGNAAQAVSGFPGKVSAACLIGAAVLLQAAGAWVRDGRIKNQKTTKSVNQTPR